MAEPSDKLSFQVTVSLAECPQLFRELKTLSGRERSGRVRSLAIQALSGQIITHSTPSPTEAIPPAASPIATEDDLGGLGFEFDVLELQRNLRSGMAT